METQKLLTEFRAQFPEFGIDDYPDGAVLGWIETARDIHSVSERALLWCAAHLIALDRDDSHSRRKRKTSEKYSSHAPATGGCSFSWKVGLRLWRWQ